MNTILLILLISVPIVLFIGITSQTANCPDYLINRLTMKAYLAVSSCLGDSFRARYSGNPSHVAFDGSYLRTMTNSGPAMSEHIEMESMLHDPAYEEEP